MKTSGFRSQMLWTLFSNSVILFLLVYGSWHQALFPHNTLHFEIFSLRQIPLVGLENLIYIVLALGVISPFLLKSFIGKKPDLLEILIMAWPLLFILNLRDWNTSGIVNIENSVLLSVLLLGLLRHEDFAASFKVFANSGLFFFTLSYSLAVLLPFLIAWPGMNVHQDYGGVSRFAGWNNAPSIIGFCGLDLMVWAGISTSYRKPDCWNPWNVAWAIGVGLLGIHLSVLRIALFAALVFFIYSAYIEWRAGHSPFVRFFGVIILLCAFSFFDTSILAKTSYLNLQWFNRTESLLHFVKHIHRVDNEPRPSAVPPEIPSVSAPPHTNLPAAEWVESTQSRKYDWSTLETLDSIINSNGRLGLFNILLSNIRGYYAFGRGTGWSANYLQQLKYPIRQPHCEYLRILMDHGLIGLTLFLMIGVWMFYRLRHEPLGAIPLILGILFLTDNLLVYPTFGYGPLLLASVLASYPKRESGKAGEQPH